MIFWTYIEKELSDLMPEFEETFEGLKLSRDYENRWEWIHGKNTNGEYFNISREHNWKQGLYEEPLFINIKADNEENFDEIGYALKNVLATTINYGGTGIHLNGYKLSYVPVKQY